MISIDDKIQWTIYQVAINSMGVNNVLRYQKGFDLRLFSDFIYNHQHI